MLREVDVLVANEEDLQSMLGVDLAGGDIATGRLAEAGFRTAAEYATGQFGPRLVAVTLRDSVSAGENGWSALLWDADAGHAMAAPRYDLRVVDRIGAGDSFVAGLIDALVTNRAREQALAFALAASASKHTIPGAFNRVSVEEVERLMGGDTSGRVRR
jgi:2-dehydro-3-deoxygluconokinase